jgi:hypothetical protein
VTAWPWLALVGVVLLVACAVGGWVGSRRWQGLGARYETPTDRAGARGQRVASDWDRLDAGEDPTSTGADGSAGSEDPATRDERPGT